ncbi:MAG: hypothetical protein INR72_18510, partial [Williamsia herbipolensis]|nr:hypothetical protein [Williamsia herbipolensis]
VCTTLGSQGARLRSRTDDLTEPAIAAADDVVDQDGAGDTFAATVVAARLRGLSWAGALRVAAQVTARAVTVAGPMAVALGPDDLHGTSGT